MLRLTLRVRPCLILLPIIFFASACAPQTTPTPFRPPTQPEPTKIFPTTTTIPTIYTAIPTPIITATISGPCTNNLEFLQDVTIEDNTSVLAGASIDKQWLIKNSGTCNWDSTYHLKWISGDPLGAVQEQALFPARAGTQATLRVLFTAPAEAGFFESAWQAVDPNGNIFGELIFIKIVVAPQ